MSHDSKYWVRSAEPISVDSDQTAPMEQPDQGLHFLPWEKP